MLQNVCSGFATLEKRLYQLVIARLDGDRIGDVLYRDHILDLAKKGIAGFMLRGGARDELQSFIGSLQSLAERPLFIASYAERGIGEQIRETTRFPSPMAFAAAMDVNDPRDLHLLSETFTAIAAEAADCGINMPLIRVGYGSHSSCIPASGPGTALPSPGETRWFSSELAATLRDSGFLALSEGPGNSVPDGMTVVAYDGALSAGLCDSVREPGVAVYMEAGVDILLGPEDPDAVVDELARALLEGRITEERIAFSLARVDVLKSMIGSVGEMKADYPRNERLSRLIAGKAVTLVKGKGRFFPVRDSDNIPLVYAGDTSYFRTSPLRFYVKQASHVGKPLPTHERPVMYLIFTDEPFRGASNTGEEEMESVVRLMRGTTPSVVVSFGSPYVLNRFKEAAVLIAAYDASAEAQDAVFRCITGEMDFQGRLPVTLDMPDKPGR